ncbi:MAG: carbohydrate ABC transporter permease [Erysipelotrichaceae bacterium]|nr:carbohydrate ABC transporter permease [Erysipelotrichaceae bacterium]
MKKKLKFVDLLCLTLLMCGACIMIFPFLWMILSSLKTQVEVSTIPPTLLPSRVTFENYLFALKTAPFARYFLNSLIVTVACVAITMFTTILAAFAFSRLRFPGRDIVFAALIAMMMIPFEMLIITNYTTIARWGLMDNLIALIIPFTASIFYTYILRNFFLSIPDSLYYSAKVDGSSDWKYLWWVMVPIAKPTIITIALLNTIAAWNSFLWTVLVINSTSNRTLPFGVFVFIAEGGVRYERLMAAATIVVLPMIFLFLFARKYIVAGVSKGGIKG